MLFRSLAGPRSYAGTVIDDSWMGNGRRDVGAADIDAALSLYIAACVAVSVTAVAAAGLGTA